MYCCNIFIIQRRETFKGTFRETQNDIENRIETDAPENQRSSIYNERSSIK